MRRRRVCQVRRRALGHWRLRRARISDPTVGAFYTRRPMYRPVTFTLDLEDLRTSPRQEPRVEVVTHQLLDRFAELGVRGTVFCVAELADRYPKLIRRVADEGHEVAVHGLQHTPLDHLAPETFRRRTIEAKALLEDAAEAPVVGFRAPQFSLVPETSWAPEVLADLGFVYSSSVLPTASSLYGWPGAPRTPFRWPSGLVELPCPLVSVAGRDIPFLGGAYLRILPAALRRKGLADADPDAVLWTYCHPWEFDPDERFYVFEHGGLAASVVGWINRKGMMGRVEGLLEVGVGPPLGEVARTLSDAVIVDPVRSTTRRRGLQGVLRRRSDAA
jgi:polysaccharide deacetylase family protein (PEP-CTERM system associated)